VTDEEIASTMFLSWRPWRARARTLERFAQLSGRNLQFRRNAVCYGIAETALASLDPSDGCGTKPHCASEQGLSKTADDAPIPGKAILGLDIDHIFNAAVQVFENPRKDVDLGGSLLVFPSADRSFGDTGKTAEIRPRQLLVHSRLFETCRVEPAHHAPGHGAGSLVVAMVGIAGHDARRPLQLAHRMVESVEHIGYSKASDKGRHLQRGGAFTADCPH
jgi:hypothetical protein